MMSLKSRLAKLERPRQAGVGKWPFTRFWAWLSTGAGPIEREDFPPGMLESLEEYQRTGRPPIDVVEQRIKAALERSAAEAQNQSH